MTQTYNTKEAATLAASDQFGEAVAVGDLWAVKPLLLSVDQVAGLLGCSKRKVWQLNAAGKLPEVIHPTPGKTRWRFKDIMNLSY